MPPGRIEGVYENVCVYIKNAIPKNLFREELAAGVQSECLSHMVVLGQVPLQLVKARVGVFEKLS